MNNTQLQSKTLELLNLSFMDTDRKEAWRTAVPHMKNEHLEELIGILLKEIQAFADLSMKHKVS